MKKSITFILLLILLLLPINLTSCSNSLSGNKEIIIGTMSQPGEPILNHIKQEFEEKTGYTLTIRIFTDFETPNEALKANEIDVNLFQHLPFLEAYNQKKGTNLVKACNMYDCAYGGYTKKEINSLEDIPDGKTITIAADGSNMKRCLDILVAEGLIEYDFNGLSVDKLNPDNINEYITSNPKNLNIRPISTALIAASLDDEDTYLGIVNATFALAAGLGTKAKLLCQEKDPLHVNTNILACRSSDLEKDWLKALVEILTSSDTDKFISETFGATITPYHA